MSYYGSGYNPIQNRDCLNTPLNSGPAYNAVINTVFTGEGSEPVTLQEAKDWCKIDVADDDTLITELITGARQICELHSNISFITRTVTAIVYNGLGRINLPYGPIVGTVSFTDEDANTLTDYDIKSPDFDRSIAIYTAGYNPLPKNLKTALLNQILWMYENRGDIAQSDKLSEQAKLILNQVKRPD